MIRFTSLGINFKDFVITLFALYAAICVLLIISPYLQSLIVYLNVVRYPLGELTDLRRFGMSARFTIHYFHELCEVNNRK